MPRIGLLSDSHGRADTTARAVRLLLDHGAELLIHLGDVGNEHVLDELLVHAPAGDGGADVDDKRASGKLVEAHVVFGNVDWDADNLARYARSIGLAVDHPVGRLSAEGASVVFLHGHDERAFAAELGRGPAYLCHGHTHKPRDDRAGPTRIVNPGALFRAAEHTVAVLDTDADAVTFLTLPRHV
jgi:hypothetical protein